MNHSVPRQAGFTLVELLVVTTLGVLLFTTASALFMTFLQGSVKTNKSLKVKAEGNYAMEQMKFLLRNTTNITTCTAGMGSITLNQADGNTVTLQKLTDDGIDKIASSSAAQNYFLTSSEIYAEPIFDCYSGPNNAYYVGINFTLRDGPDTRETKDTTFQSFSSGVTLRNFIN